jgi:4-diphosphocytidyl-2-C-methyl-D-erythritol kinase
MLFCPNSKINIGLNIVSKRSDGFHNIETVFCPIGLSDVLEFVEVRDRPVGSFTLNMTGIPVSGSVEDNLCIKAYRLLARDFSLPAIDIHLHKIVPMGAGLGGGSSDAAFMLRKLNERFTLGLSVSELCRYASQLGSDCAFFILNKPLFAYERGNVFRELAGFPEDMEILVVHPGIHVSTAEAYAGVVPHKPEEPLQELIGLSPDRWKGKIINDFEESVFKKHPDIQSIKNQLYKTGAVYASMSGSGSSVFGIFTSNAPEGKEHFPGLFTWKGNIYRSW